MSHKKTDKSNVPNSGRVRPKSATPGGSTDLPNSNADMHLKESQYKESNHNRNRASNYDHHGHTYLDESDKYGY